MIINPATIPTPKPIIKGLKVSSAGCCERCCATTTTGSVPLPPAAGVDLLSVVTVLFNFIAEVTVFVDIVLFKIALVVFAFPVLIVIGSVVGSEGGVEVVVEVLFNFTDAESDAGVDFEVVVVVGCDVVSVFVV